MPMSEVSQKDDLETLTNSKRDTSDDDTDDYFYELLGAPMLLYRNRETYTKQDEDSTLWNYQKQGGNGRSVRTKYVNVDEYNSGNSKNDTLTPSLDEAAATTSSSSSSMHAVTTNAASLFCHHQSLLYRAQARWYYPMDYHLVPKHHHPTLPLGIKSLCRKWSKQQQEQQQQQHQRTEGLSSNGDKVNVTTPSELDIQSTMDDDDDDEEEDSSANDSNHENENAAIKINQSSPSLESHQQTRAHSEPLNLNPNPNMDGDAEYMQVMEDLQNALNRRNQQPDDHEQLHRTIGLPDEHDGKVIDGAERIRPNATSIVPVTSKYRTIVTIDPKQLPPIKDRYTAVKQMFQSNEYNVSQMFQLQLQARAHMLLGNRPPDRRRNYRVRQILQAYTQLDTNYIPGQEKVKFNYTYDRSNHGATGNIVRTNHKRKMGITRQLQQQTQLYDRERLNRSKPEYMAPFHIPSVRHAVAYDLQSRRLLPTKSVSTVNRVVPAISHDDPNRPTLFGNCLLSFPCRCDVCHRTTTMDGYQQHDTDSASVPVPCLLHPVGPLQDRIRLSFLRLPLHRSIGGHYEPRRDIPEELDVGDHIRQMELCGHDPYVAIIRTDLHCSVVTVSFVCPRRGILQQPNECWGTANLQQIHRIDYRTMWRSLPSFRPIHLTCHPKYGVQKFSPSKVAVVYSSSATNMRNTIHHYQITHDNCTDQKYVVNNLQDITEIVFANQHPMIMYCIGRSFVRPTLTMSYIQKNRPRMGHGYALYSIDLRPLASTDRSNTSCSATFVWSPNIEEYTSEGIYSISGLQSDWTSRRAHYLWVSSISAGKTYLIDTRLPCQCIHTFSLPYLCDQPGAHLPPTGLYGAGTLFSCPYHLHCSKDSIRPAVRPFMTSVSKTPGAFGIHMYHVPTCHARFQAESIECMTGPNLSLLGNKLSLTRSAIVPLPDVSDHIFICGLTAFHVPIDNVLHQSYLSDIGIAERHVRDTLCIISLTNKGDIYAHMLLRSNTDKKYSKAFDDLPLGYSAIPVPTITKVPNFQWNVIPIDPTNDFPIPGHKIRSTETNLQRNSSILDLSSFIEREDAVKMRPLRNARRSKEPDHVSSNTLDFVVRDDEENETDLPLSDVPRRAVIATSTESVGPYPLTLPTRLLPRSSATGHSIQHFLPVNNFGYNDAIKPGEVWRSDLTPDVLEDAWMEQDI